ncbi:MAG: DUF2170 family protein [Candidatus Electrothrix sp. AR5]|nr:DUF2170 family protein [Candidatus Electrothrix sp. AR5]
MEVNLDDLAFRLNNHTTDEGTSFDAVLSENGVIEVVCSNVSEFQVNIASTETQLLSVTPLFLKSEVKPGGEAELNELLLQLSPAIPLSSIGLQGNTYILFGAMPLETSFEHIVHELEVQAENTVEVLDAIESLLV